MIWKVRGQVTSSLLILSLSFSKMINFSQPDTIDERVINTKKLTTFKTRVSQLFLTSPEDFSPLNVWN